MSQKWPSKSQWRQFLKVLDKREKIVFFVFLFLGLSSFTLLAVSFYLNNTKIVPAKGGIYTEGFLVPPSPRFINPIYANSDIDRDLTELVYSGLMKYGDESSQTVVPDLAKEYKVSEDGKTYEFYLKENLRWQDGQPLTADDVIFTVKTIQNYSFESPLYGRWVDVKIEKISDLCISFELQNPSPLFLENTTLKIMPKHIWQGISAENFHLSTNNLKAIGSGPYRLKKINQDKKDKIISIELTANSYYSGSPPNIEEIIFNFFETEESLVNAFNSGQVKGVASADPAGIINKVKNNGFYEYRFSLPRYYALFLNLGKSKILQNKNIREVLNCGINKEKLISEILSGRAKPVDSPILPEIYGFESPGKTCLLNKEEVIKVLESEGFILGETGIREKELVKEPAFQFKSDLKVGSEGSEVTELQKCLAKDPDVYPEGEITGYFGSKTKAAVSKFQEKYAEDVLDPYGLTSGTGEVRQGTRTKLNEICAPSTKETLPLSLTLVTVNKTPLTTIAYLIKDQWEELGVGLEIKTFDPTPIQDSTSIEEVIKLRDYEMLLFGEVLGITPDPYPFWHSSQIKDPGLNLSAYESKEADKLLEEARQTLDEGERKEALEKFQEILLKDMPAVFLYNPDYLCFVSEEIKGLTTKILSDTSQRFSGIEGWYIETKRAWK
ncbi:MAG TPA: ABC transporter substrate-binding protein [Candidatus Humimicrobiaceae bacterium]|nr:ABC transporter substrate-binding protein [Candidatus Humimicrobiaceae bacterium]